VVGRHRWLAVLAVALLGVAALTVIGGGLWVWGRLPPDSENTVWVSLYPDVGPDLRGGGKGAKALVVIAVKRGRVADPGPFGERVAALVAPTAHRSPANVDENLDGSFKLVGVHLAEPLVPRRLDTQAVQQALAAAGFRWLVVDLSVQERSQVLPHSAAEAGECWGYNGLSCEWRLATGGPPLKFEVRPVSPAEGRA